MKLEEMIARGYARNLAENGRKLEKDSFNVRFAGNSVILEQKHFPVIYVTDSLGGKVKTIEIEIGEHAYVPSIGGKIEPINHKDLVAILDAVEKKNDTSFKGKINYSFLAKHVRIDTLPEAIWPNINEFVIGDKTSWYVRASGGIEGKTEAIKTMNLLSKRKDLIEFFEKTGGYIGKVKREYNEVLLNCCPTFRQIQDLAFEFTEEPTVELRFLDLRKSQLTQISPAYDTNITDLSLTVKDSEKKEKVYELSKDAKDVYSILTMHPNPNLQATVTPMQNYFGERLKII